MHCARWSAYVTWVAVLVAASGFVAASAFRIGEALAQPASISHIPAVELIDQHGVARTGALLFDRPSVVHFGFTQCPVICPTTLYEMAERMDSLGSASAAYNFIFITVDPERDTPSVLGDYLVSFDRRIIGLSGKAEQIQKVAQWLGATYAKIPTTGGDYTMDHTVNAFLISRGGGSISSLYMGHGAKEAQVMAALQELSKAK